MLARFPVGLEIRELRLVGGVLLALALVALFVVPAVGAFALLDRAHRVLSVGCGILAGSAAYEPLRSLRPARRRAEALGNGALIAAAAFLVVGLPLRLLVARAEQPLYDGCLATAFVIALILADRVRTLLREAPLRASGVRVVRTSPPHTARTRAAERASRAIR